MLERGQEQWTAAELGLLARDVEWVVYWTGCLWRPELDWNLQVFGILQWRGRLLGCGTF